jgi:hypothetical protein|tara:strand:+ start:928 stop:1326 length:399 start_codon:yes stop_codon:yes gene_type:complete
MKKYITGLLLLAFVVPSWADSWECRQLRDVLVAPPYYIDQETMDAPFEVQVGSSEIRLSLDDEQVFQCETETCRKRLSAMDFLLKGENSEANFILSAVGANVGFRATYSVTSKPSVGETMIQMGVCSKAASG